MNDWEELDATEKSQIVAEEVLECNVQVGMEYAGDTLFEGQPLCACEDRHHSSVKIGIKDTNLSIVALYASHISAAMQAVHKMEKDGWLWSISNHYRADSSYRPSYVVEFWTYDDGEPVGLFKAESDESIPDAICHAAVKAVRGEQ